MQFPRRAKNTDTRFTVSTPELELYPADGLTVAAAVVSPLALNLLSVLGLPVLALVLWYFKFLYGVFSGPIDSEGYGA